MKAITTCKPMYRVKTKLPYPNAASRRQIFDKVIDLLLMGASGAGAAAIVLLLLALA